MTTMKKDWQFGVAGITNPKNPGALRFYFDFVRANYSLLDGDIVEAGVYQGKSLLGMALMLKELGSSKKVYGFDSFSGFPPVYDQKDNFERFEELYSLGLISHEHLIDVRQNLEWRNYLSGQKVNSMTISGSGDFSLTSSEYVQKKIELLKLDNIVLVDGPFHETMIDVKDKVPVKIMCALMDCDLYQSYIATLNFVWPRLVAKGLIYLDEYYSLKFPGARIATNEFTASHSDATLERFPSEDGEFERWGLYKRE